VDYVGAGTVEFLLDGNGHDVYFLEMNTRLQVEHPVTEMITGLDLVELQLRAAAGEPLGVAQQNITPDGHAIEVRLYAEDPAVGFLPQTGTVLDFEVPTREGVRVDAGIEQGSVVSPHYDPMLAKLIVHAADRDTALERLTEVVRATRLFGLRHNLEWLGDLLADPAVRADEVTTSWLDSWGWTEPAVPDAALAVGVAALATARRDHHPDPTVSPWEALGARRTGAGGWHVAVRDRDTDHALQVRRTTDGAAEVVLLEDLATGASRLLDADGAAAGGSDPDRVWVQAEGRTRLLELVPATRHLDLDAVGGDAALVSPMPGSVVTVDVAEGDHVTAGQTLLVVEAMKMEHPITAPTDGTVVGLSVRAGNAVDAGQALVTVHPNDAPSGRPNAEDGA
jgi:acetyl-CoA/propionyl-CoA carboxylase biotin carboxyl carrier protein